VLKKTDAEKEKAVVAVWTMEKGASEFFLPSRQSRRKSAALLGFRRNRRENSYEACNLVPAERGVANVSSDAAPEVERKHKRSQKDILPS
jgi:hypothetical protein